MEILTMLAPIISNGARSGLKRKGLVGITIHDTGNPATGAGAKNHGLYLQGGGKNNLASWHYAVDKDYAVQSIPEDEVAWHAGDGTGDGNYKTIAIEICVNADGDLLAATNNGAKLAATLLKKYGLPSSALYQHNHWSGKNCPAQIRKNNPYNWETFKQKVNEYMGATTSNPVTAKPTVNTYVIGQRVRFGTCYVSSTAPDSEAIPVSKMLKDNGVITKIVSGTKNPYLLDNGLCWVNDRDIKEVLSVQQTSAPVIDCYAVPNYSGGSVADALNTVASGLGSYSNRTRIAAKNGIANYTGTPSQNIQMLNLLKNGKLKKI